MHTETAAISQSSWLAANRMEMVTMHQRQGATFSWSARMLRDNGGSSIRVIALQARAAVEYAAARRLMVVL